VLGFRQEQLARAFASKAPHTEKFREVAFSEREGVPILEGAIAWVACGMRELHPGGDHEILIGDVLAVGGEGGDPLVFFGGAYRPLD
jgi:flavin reductase (DIM6/NTAB) family NADH-FMN oxidoreductase RutF